MRTLTKAAIGGAGVLFAGWIGWGLYSTRTVKSIPYERMGTHDGHEIRNYPELVLAETSASTQRTAFRRLFSYISGANQSNESISMTAPVETQGGRSVQIKTPVRSESVQEDSDELRMAFYLPSEYDPETAPEPTDSNVQVITEPPKTVVVDRFSWYAPEWRVTRRQRKLLSQLDEEGVEPVGSASLLRYNDPWTPPFLRRNEVAVPVAATV
jgi:hypothetical protein